jgi:predicted Fe-S protein YdhL (DUF1289 family)
MPLFPKIASPCPYVKSLSEIMDGDVCRMCERQVFDLTAMSDGERLAFLSSCEGEVCVSYSIPVRQAVRAAVIAASLAVPASAAARPAQRPVVPPPMVVVAGGLPPPPQVQIVPVPPVLDRSEDVAPLYMDPERRPEADPKPPKG